MAQILPVPSLSVFPEASSFLLLFRFSWKFRSSWFVPAAASLLVLSSNIGSFCYTWELDAASWLCSLATGLPELFQSSWQGALNISGLFDAIGLCRDEELVAACKTRFNVCFDFATILSSPLSSWSMFAVVSGLHGRSWNSERCLIKLKCLMLNKWRRLFHSSRELVFGVDVFDLNLWIQIDSVKQLVKSNSVGSG